MTAREPATLRSPATVAALATAAATAATTAAAVAALLVRGRPLVVLYDLWVLFNAPLAIVLSLTGTYVLRHSPGHLAGKILLASGAASAAHVVAAACADAGLVAAGLSARPAELASIVPGELPLAASVPVWFMSWLWVVGAVPVLVVLPLVFPDGQPPRGRWRLVGAVAVVAGTCVLVSEATLNWPTAPWGEDTAPPAIGVLLAVGGIGVAASAGAALVSFVLRWHRSAGRRRSFEILGGTLAVVTLAMVAAYPWQALWTVLVHVSVDVIVIAYAVAVARYRLHDIEPALSKSHVATAVSWSAAGLYLTVVVGLGLLLGRHVDHPLVPTIVVALAAALAGPTRRWVRRLVEGRLYGARADRGEVLSSLADHGVPADDHRAGAIGDIAELVRRGTGATSVRIRLGATEVLTDPAGSGAPVLEVPIPGEDVPAGTIALFAHAVADLDQDAAALCADVARMLGLMLRNERLTDRLASQVEELRASRRRLVNAQDSARRGLERDLHDGAQARLVALRLRVATLQAGLSPSADAALVEGLGALGTDLDAAIRSLRDLARGWRPPILEQAGVAAAVRAHARGLPTPVEVVARGTARFPAPVEAAVYFSCLEAMHNAVRHARAGEVTVEIVGDGAGLSAVIGDDGVGFDPAATSSGAGLANIGDRIGALGGTVLIDTRPGAGTRVSVTVPHRRASDSDQRPSAAR